MTKTVSVKLANAIREIEAADIRIHEDYSGRGMFGEKCFALSCDGSIGVLLSDLLRAVACEGSEAVEELADMFESMRTDSLGLGKIYYFPGWILPESEDEDDEERSVP